MRDLFRYFKKGLAAFSFPIAIVAFVCASVWFCDMIIDLTWFNVAGFAVTTTIGLIAIGYSKSDGSY